MRNIVKIFIIFIILCVMFTVVHATNIDEQAKLIFNQKFTQYQGTDTRGSMVEALIAQIIVVNADEDEYTPQIEFNMDGITEPSQARPKLSSTYTVVFDYDNTPGSLTKGMINKVTINVNNSNIPSTPDFDTTTNTNTTTNLNTNNTTNTSNTSTNNFSNTNTTNNLPKSGTETQTVITTLIIVFVLVSIISAIKFATIKNT